VPRNRRSASRRKLLIEILEDRCLPSSYYVATTGSDQNSGTLSQPFATIQHALNVGTHPGDTISVRAGTYHEKVSFPASGSVAGGFITLQAYPGEQAVLDGTGVAGADMVFLNNVNYIRLIGFEITNDTGVNDGSGVRILGSGDHLQILHNIIHHIYGVSAMGVTVYGTSTTAAVSNLLIDSNVIYDCQPSPSEALTLNGNVNGFQVTNNIVHDVNNIGIDMIGGEKDINPTYETQNGTARGNNVFRARSNYGGGYAAGIYVDGGQNIVLEDNVSYQNDLGLEIGAENAGITASGIVVRNNLIHDNDKAGLVFGGYDATVGRVAHCSLYNNTVVNNDTLNAGFGQLWIQFGSNNQVANNIFWAAANDIEVFTDTNTIADTLDHNLYWANDGAANAQYVFNNNTYTGFAAYQKATGQDAHSLFRLTGFINAKMKDFRLSSQSPAVNAGTSAAGLFAPADFDGIARPQGAGVDIGAFDRPVSGAVRPDGATLLYIPATPTSAQDPSFSPDGTTLLFTLYQAAFNLGTAGLYTLLLANPTRPATVLDAAGHQSMNLSGASWSPATMRIVFASDRSGVSEIWTANPDGTGLVQVTHHTSTARYVHPTFSPDGQTIVFEVDANVPDSQQEASLWEVHTDGTGLIELVDGPTTGFDNRAPNWSPTGSAIVFQRRLPGSSTWNLDTIKPDGTGLLAVTNDHFANVCPSWSPDGKWIVFSSNRGGLVNANLFVIAATGGASLRATFDANYADVDPSWSPDGKTLVFSSHEGGYANAPAALWRMAVPTLPAAIASPLLQPLSPATSPGYERSVFPAGERGEELPPPSLGLGMATASDDGRLPSPPQSTPSPSTQDGWRGRGVGGEGVAEDLSADPHHHPGRVVGVTGEVDEMDDASGRSFRRGQAEEHLVQRVRRQERLDASGADGNPIARLE
jgi:Tol biopolymer transport system component